MQTQYQPKTGQACHCRKGQERDNCPDCEGTGQRIDFVAIRNRRSLCPFCGAGYHGEDTKPSVTCTQHLWAANETLRSELRRALKGLEEAIEMGTDAACTSTRIANARTALETT